MTTTAEEILLEDLRYAALNADARGETNRGERYRLEAVKLADRIRAGRAERVEAAARALVRALRWVEGYRYPDEREALDALERALEGDE